MTNEEFIKSISLEGEEWRDVVGWENLYKVSSFGRIATLSHTIDYTSDYDGEIIPKIYKVKQCVRKMYKDRAGYSVVTLRKGKYFKLLKVHRLVAMAFIPNPKNLPQVNHKDEDKSNNTIENLEWCSDLYNNNYGTRNKRIRQKIAKAHKDGRLKGAAKASSKSVVAVSLDDGSTIAFERMSYLHEYGFERHLVSKCCRNIRESYKGYKWYFQSDYEALTNKSKNAIPNPN